LAKPINPLVVSWAKLPKIPATKESTPRTTFSGTPERAAKIFADIIDVDHLLLMQMIRTVAADPRRYDLTVLVRAVAGSSCSSAPRAGVSEIMEAELYLLGVGFAAVGQSAFLNLLNSVGDILIATPEAGEAFYEPLQPAGHVRVARQRRKSHSAKPAG
jgi:GntR family transcriptional repressor for pyruvate dehydrogenase complex